MFTLAAIIFVTNCVIIPVLNCRCTTVRNKLKELYKYSCVRTFCKILYDWKYTSKFLLVHYCICFLGIKYKDLPDDISLKICLLYSAIILSFLSIFSIINDLNR